MRLRLRLPSALSLFLLSFFHLAASQPSNSHPSSSLSHISLRAAYPRDVVANWTFIYSENDTLCPRSIQHLGFNRRKKGPIRIFHHRIIQDRTRCKNNRKLKGRRFRFFPSDLVRAAFKNRTTPYRIPQRLVRLLNLSGPTRRAFRAANKHGEHYLIGYEGRNRVCGEKRIFKKGTTAFLFRPNTKSVNIKGIAVSLTPGKRYMIMIPLFKGISCVYSSELRMPEGNGTTVPEDPDNNSKDEAGNELEAKSDSGSCFPATASVLLADGRKVAMKHLSLRDSVQVGTNEYASVFMFTHRVRTGRSVFHRIELDSGEKLDVTGGHYVHANGRLVTASQVQIGDMMPLANGSHARVRALDKVSGLGLYNPQTMHDVGDIVVNGIRVSTYTEAVKPQLAHTVLSPLRAAFRFLSMDLSFGILEGGASIRQSARALLR